MKYNALMKVFVPDFWSDLSYEEKLRVYNGVGAEYFPSWLRNLLDLVFWWAAEPVMVHDVEYVFGDSKLWADVRLLINCILRCDFRISRIIISILVFSGVFLFGYKAWKNGRQENK